LANGDRFRDGDARAALRENACSPPLCWTSSSGRRGARGRIAPMGSRIGDRVRRNLATALASAALTAVLFQFAGQKASLSFQWSLATGYTSVALIGVALGLGPWWVHRGGRMPVSTDLRRDIGLWGSAFAIMHVVVGLQVHGNGDMLSYFLYLSGGAARHAAWIRLDAFGLANWVGLAATVLLVVLTVISNDRSLRALGARRWKKLQQFTYAAAVLIVLHGAAYQILDKRAAPFVIIFALLVSPVLALQLRGRSLRNATGDTAPIVSPRRQRPHLRMPRQ
jgi:methionine sulfoxide reductase heme-binding subunit